MSYKTTDYLQFRTIQGNRPINSTHVRNLVESVKKKNLLQHNPIFINENYEVIDGQHRLEAAKRLKIPVFYTIIKEADIEEVQLLNSNSKRWGLEDYLESYIGMGNQEYAEVKKFAIMYELPITTCIMLLSTKSALTDINTDFKQGRFVIDNAPEAHKVAAYVYEFKDYLQKGVYKSRHFIYAVRDLMRSRKANMTELHRKIIEQRKKLLKQETMQEFLRNLETIYNFRRQKKVRFF